MVEYLGLKASGWHVMVKYWWELILSGILLASTVMGSVVVLVLIYRKVKNYQHGSRQISKLPRAVESFFSDLRSKTKWTCPPRDEARKSKSFGVFLGSFDTPPTQNQARLLSQWDIIVLDPFQAGVLEAISSQCSSVHMVGRLDVEMVVPSYGGSGNTEIISSLSIIAQVLATRFRHRQNNQWQFRGVLLANWSSNFPPIVFNELIKYINNSLGLDVYLEIAPPTFLTESQCREIDLSLIQGIAFRNGTILEHGAQRDYYQMEDMRRALRAVKVQTVMSGATVMMWETVEDDVVLEHAVIKRSFIWSNFNSVMTWIGPKGALTDAQIATTKVVTEEPLGALMWLKGDEAMKAHDWWRTNKKICQRQCVNNYDSLESFIPNLSAKLSLVPVKCENEDESSVSIIDGAKWAEWPQQSRHTRANPFSFSPHGHDYTGLGCFQLGLDCSIDDSEELVQTQRRLRDLGLLKCLAPEELRLIGVKLEALHLARSLEACSLDEARATKELICLISTTSGDGNDRLRVYKSLDTGFRTTIDSKFWGLYDVDPISGTMDIYISEKTKDLTSTILHTFLSKKGLTRAQCFMAEMALAEQNGSLAKENWFLAPRLVHDIELLSPAEMILFLRHLALSDCDKDSKFLVDIRSCCEFQLLEVPSLVQLRALNSTAYIGGEITAESLITSRLIWYRERGFSHPNPSAAIDLFTEVEARLSNVLLNRQRQLLSQLEIFLQNILEKDQIDASADLFCLSVFCAFRKLALDEVYMEIMDRNALPNAHSDQAACFAEMFALGSRCENYFDMTPNVLGRILSDKIRSYYKLNQPPRRDDASTELPTAYSSAQIDLDPDAGPPKLPIYYHITFIGIFALPALVDILLLSTIGRGLYVTAYMDEFEKTMATTALMLALLMCGAFGTWISNGGSYYLHSMAFPAMNMFVLTRFIAGVAVSTAGGILALIVIGTVKGFYAGIAFFLYFLILSTYLTVLATLATLQYPNFTFQSGRVIIMTRVPILLVSPILTLWVLHHDVLIYLCVMATFLISLLLGVRTIISQWSNWYLKIPCITDHDAVNWYEKKKASSDSSPGVLGITTDLAATPLPRKALLADVLAERNRRPWKKSTTDELVLRLAEGYSATMFLMDWYCKYSRTKMPFPYSPTWNLQCKAAVETLRDIQKGLKLHNAFIHWRNAGDEVWCGILYFIIALLDKWVALVTGASVVGLSDANNATFRLAVGFGLAYYLIGAVCLDGVSQPLWQLANKKIPQPVVSLQSLQQAAMNDSKAKRGLYWKNLIKFFCLHLWGLSIMSSLMWLFENSLDATVMFLSYVTAYTGLLWYQYNRIFAGSLVLKDLIIAVIVGLLAGLLMHHFQPRLAFNNVIALGIGTWTAGFLSVWTSNLWTPSFKGQTSAEAVPKFHSCSTLDPHSEMAQSVLSEIFDSICAVPAELCYRLDPLTYPGIEVMDILMSRSYPPCSRLVQAAFPSAKHLIRTTAERWKNGETVIDLVPARLPIQQEHKMRAVSRSTGEQLHVFIFIGLDITGGEWIMDIRRNCQVIAEAVMKTTTESIFGLSHSHSTLAELLVVRDNDRGELCVPEGVKRQLETSTTERTRVVKNGDKALLRSLLLGLDCEKDWDTLPRNIRSFLLRRCCGQPRPLSDDHLSWISSRFCTENSLDVKEFVARCNLGATLTELTVTFAGALEANPMYLYQPKRLDSSYDISFGGLFAPSVDDSDKQLVELLKRPFYKTYFALRSCLKFFVVSLVADPEFQRELDYFMSGKPWFLRWPVTFFLNGVWIYSKTLQQIILPLFLLHGRENISSLYSNVKGMKTVIEKDRIVIESLSGPSTCFVTAQLDGSFQVAQYSGCHYQKPEGLQQLMSINTFCEKLFLRRREEYAYQSRVNLFQYEHPEENVAKQGGKLRKPSRKIPIRRRCIEGTLNGQVIQYDNNGYITSGSGVKDNNPIEFKFWYRKNPTFGDELLRAEYVLPFIKVEVFWSVPHANHPEKLDKWIPHYKVIQATFVQGSMIYKSTWHYDHKFHPVISTTLNGETVPTPPMIQFDWLDILRKPKNCNFSNDNPLLSFKKLGTSFISRILGFNTRWYPISTSRARTHIWKTWKNGKELDAVLARWLDDVVLRSERVLKPYWYRRNMGQLRAAQSYLDSQADTIMARIDIEPEISSWTPLAFKISDLYSFGQGGDTRINTRTLSTQLQDSDSNLHVLAMDTGTWPNEGGGVSACRRDMVNNLDTIRWHIIAESANDFGIPKFQIEKNVQSLTVLPLWGLDFLTPTHGLFQDCLDSEVQKRSHDTRDADIKKRFIPILTTLVRCSRAIHLNHHHIQEATKALVDLNMYFESSRHWSDVWMNDIVKEKWRELWLTEDMENTIPISEWLDAERPTISHMDQALDMWQRYLFIFSIPIPEEIPDVFQASHHFAGASYGVICKVKRNCTLQVWDHCISWREVTVFLSSSMSFDCPFVCTALMSLSRVASVLILHHADVVLPCADFFNPGWEIELGSGQGTFEHRHTFARKIDPVVNGITGMENFKPIEALKSKLPTAIMLSHVRFVKDIKTAILAADIIVNDWGFNDYRLDIYGDMEKAPTYSVECQEIIASKSLRDNVCLRGLGSPSKVLEYAWIFLNSSVSEGLPLALGEAALTGVPVVCTDVGASFRVVTDPITSKRFSAVVPPNDALSLARAQINVLALLDEWSAFAEDEEGYRPKLSAQPTREEVERITKRMYEKTEQRRRLGMMGRTNVLNSFSSERYLREHEQMLWIGKYRSGSYRSRMSTPTSSNGESTPVGDASAHGSRLWYKAAVQEKARVGRITSIPISSNASWAITEGEQSSRSNSSNWPEITIPEKARTSTTDKSSLFIEF